MVGDEEEEEYEEYEWAGQTRIRTTTLLPGGLAASGFQTGSKVSAEEEEDIDLDVDGCDQATFGEAQYPYGKSSIHLVPVRHSLCCRRST